MASRFCKGLTWSDIFYDQEDWRLGSLHFVTVEHSWPTLQYGPFQWLCQSIFRFVHFVMEELLECCLLGQKLASVKLCYRMMWPTNSGVCFWTSRPWKSDLWDCHFVVITPLFFTSRISRTWPMGQAFCNLMAKGRSSSSKKNLRGMRSVVPYVGETVL